MLWTPRNHVIGDITIIRVDDEYHLFTEALAHEHAKNFAGKRVVLHAVSRDMFHWEELPDCFGCGEEGEFDGFTIFHMDAYVHEGTWYIHYTGLDKRGPGQQQVVGLATSPDGIHWTKHPRNPVLRADLNYYEAAIPPEATYQAKDGGRLWFRDPCIIRDPRTGEFGMIVIARDRNQHPDVRGCLAWATSPDLVEWTAHPPVFSPGRFHTIETPSIFEHDGRHYIVYMTHPDWGSPVIANDPYQTAGDYYAVSTQGWTGPYEPPADEVLVAAHGQMRLGAARLVDGVDGGYYIYSWLVMQPAADDLQPEIIHHTVVPYPRRVAFKNNGEMHVVYNCAIEGFTTADAGSPAARTLKELGGRKVATDAGEYSDLIYAARVHRLRGERAGLVVRAGEDGTMGLYAVADWRHGRIEFGTLNGDRFVDARRWQPRDEVELKIVAHGTSIEVYADDRLMIHQVRYREQTGRLGYLVEHAEALFTPAALRVFKSA